MDEELPSSLSDYETIMKASRGHSEIKEHIRLLSSPGKRLSVADIIQFPALESVITPVVISYSQLKTNLKSLHRLKKLETISLVVNLPDEEDDMRIEMTFSSIAKFLHDLPHVDQMNISVTFAPCWNFTLIRGHLRCYPYLCEMHKDILSLLVSKRALRGLLVNGPVDISLIPDVPLDLAEMVALPVVAPAVVSLLVKRAINFKVYLSHEAIPIISYVDAMSEILLETSSTRLKKLNCPVRPSAASNIMLKYPNLEEISLLVISEEDLRYFQILASKVSESDNEIAFQVFHQSVMTPALISVIHTSRLDITLKDIIPESNLLLNGYL